MLPKELLNMEGELLDKPRMPGTTPPMLVNEIARLFHARMKEFDLEGVMSQDSARLIMHALRQNDGSSQLSLVRKTHLKAPTVSVTLKRMEEEGLVRREPDPMDMRVTRVYLSDQGREHNRQVRARLRELDVTLMKGFTKQEAEQLMQYLSRMRDNILPDYMKNNSCKTE